MKELVFQIIIMLFGIFLLYIIGDLKDENIELKKEIIKIEKQLKECENVYI